MNRRQKNCFKRKWKLILGPCLESMLMLLSSKVYSQDGNAGINQANTTVRGYFDAGTNLMYAIGAILGLIGAIKVYQKWNHGDHDTGKVAAAWFGSCIFLVIVATVLKSFFGL
jgi:Domain of unknown function (DUF4134)